MKTKTLLLGTAAAFMVAGSAQAADLSIGAGVDYVQICELFGTGYFYIPGTETCLKIGGKVDFSVRFASEPWVLTGVSIDDGSVTHSSHWKFVTEGEVDFSAKSMTEWGALTGYVKLGGDFDHSSSTENLKEAYLSLGHLLLGYTGSVTNTPGGYAPGAWTDTDISTNQVRLSWAASGFGVMLGIEDPRKRWGTELTDDDELYSMPDIVGAVTFAASHLDVKLMGALGWIEELAGPDAAMVYGVAGVATADMGQFALRVGGSFGTGASFVGTAPNLYNHANNWTAFVSAIFRATSAVSIAGTFAYADSDVDVAATSAGAKLVWAPVAGFEAYAEAKAWKWETDSTHTWEAKIGASRSW